MKSIQFNIITQFSLAKYEKRNMIPQYAIYYIRYSILFRKYNAPNCLALKKVCFWHDELLIMIYGIFTIAIFLCIFFHLPYKYKNRKYSDNISMLNVMIWKYMLKYENWVTIRSIYAISYFFDLEYFRSLPFVLDAASAIFWKVSKNEPKTTIVVLKMK